jgi:hypothetical protein
MEFLVEMDGFTTQVGSPLWAVSSGPCKMRMQSMYGKVVPNFALR